MADLCFEPLHNQLISLLTSYAGIGFNILYLK